jgi:hypothetical protein
MYLGEKKCSMKNHLLGGFFSFFEIGSCFVVQAGPNHLDSRICFSLSGGQDYRHDTTVLGVWLTPLKYNSLTV